MPNRHPGEGRGPVPSPDPLPARSAIDPLLIALVLGGVTLTLRRPA